MLSRLRIIFNKLRGRFLCSAKVPQLPVVDISHLSSEELKKRRDNNADILGVVYKVNAEEFNKLIIKTVQVKPASYANNNNSRYK